MPSTGYNPVTLIVPDHRLPLLCFHFFHLRLLSKCSHQPHNFFGYKNHNSQLKCTRLSSFLAPLILLRRSLYCVFPANDHSYYLVPAELAAQFQDFADFVKMPRPPLSSLKMSIPWEKVTFECFSSWSRGCKVHICVSTSWRAFSV